MINSIGRISKTTKVLIVDDDLIQRLILRTNLENEDYEVIESTNGIEALEQITNDPDIRLMITDLIMPKMDGFDLIKNVRNKESRYTYIIVLSSVDDKKSLVNALSLGADDYLTKPVFPDELKLRLKSGTRLIRLESQEELLFSLSKLAEFRSAETGYHLERSFYYTQLLSRDLSKNEPSLGLTMTVADEIARVSPLHDIGKVGIKDEILNKPGKLSKEEFEIMKSHTTIGGKILKELYDKIGSPYLWMAYEIAMFHHERWDGQGYPLGLKSYNIPLAARIMSLADVYDALSSKRCYKDANTHDEVRALIIREAGKQFDPIVVNSFLRQEKKWLEFRQKYQDSY